MKVNWDDEIPNIWENKIDVPNHQPALERKMSQSPPTELQVHELHRKVHGMSDLSGVTDGLWRPGKRGCNIPYINSDDICMMICLLKMLVFQSYVI